MDTFTEVIKLATAVVLLAVAILKLKAMSDAGGSNHADENGRDDQ